MDHKHWHEPTSLAVVVERQKLAMEVSPHKVNWSHMPVPKSAVERPEVGLERYLGLLRELIPVLQEHDTELYLGCVHEYEPELTKQMIEAVERVLPGLQFWSWNRVWRWADDLGGV